jgi:hypothetical protein
MTRLATTTYSNGRIPIDEASAEEEAYLALSLTAKIKSELSLLWFSLKLFFSPQSTIHSKLSRTEQVRTILALRFVTTSRGSVLFASMVFSPSLLLILIVCLAVPEFRAGCTDCAPNNLVVSSALIPLAGVMLLNSQLFVLKCRNFPDGRWFKMPVFVTCRLTLFDTQRGGCFKKAG